MGEISCQWKKQIPRFADSARDDNLGSVVVAWHYFHSGQQEIEGAGDEGLEVLAVDDGVEETVFEEEFGALEAFGEFLADGAFHHTRAAGAGDGDEGLAGLDGELDAARDFFADYRAHGAADKAELHGAHDDGASVELAFGSDDGIIHAEFFLGFAEARGVGLGVDELERVGGGHARVVLGPAAVEKHFEALLGIHFEVKLALGADEKIRFEILAEDDSAAGLALDPQAFGAHAALFGRSCLFNRFFVALEPSHGGKLSVLSYKF